MSAARLQPMPVNRPVSTHLARIHASAMLATDWMEMDGLVKVCVVLCGWITIVKIHTIIMISLTNHNIINAPYLLISAIHECNDGSHSCEHNCVDTAGAFVCSCFAGYTLASNGFSCLSMCKCTCFCVYEHVCGTFMLLRCIADMRIPDN
jgi:hypothetical protein